jgi:hypothetical protein
LLRGDLALAGSKAVEERAAKIRMLGERRRTLAAEEERLYLLETVMCMEEKTSVPRPTEQQLKLMEFQGVGACRSTYGHCCRSHMDIAVDHIWTLLRIPQLLLITYTLTFPNAHHA